MKIKVCDAICGKGKTSAVINMMNEGGDEHRYIFITQFLTEVERIVNSCSSKGFVAPSDQDCRKMDNLNDLLRQRKNIASTHALFLSMTEETKQLIDSGHYTLVLDEVIDVMSMAGMSEADVKILSNSNTIKEEENGEIIWIDNDYDVLDKRSKFREEALVAKSKRLHKFEDEYFFWSIPADLFACFEDVYILTYMFEAQPLKCFFEINNIEYELIGVRNNGGKYELCAASEMERKIDLRSKIHIIDNKKLNSIGDKNTDLSYTWYTFASGGERTQHAERIRKNLINLKRNIYGCASEDFMWTSFKGNSHEIKDKGIVSGFVVYNKRASNEYSNRHYLAYCVNNFPRPWEAKYYREHGSVLDGNMYALSTLVQWLFRSAIRRGEDVWIYVPSSRMRKLLIKWLDNLADGRDLELVAVSKNKKVVNEIGGVKCDK